jgi:hypothetical protein
MQDYCGVSGASLNVGNDSNLEYIYKTGYIWQNSQWTYPSTVKFDPNQTSSRNQTGRDVNSDGNLDLVLSFKMQKTDGCFMR